MGMFRADAGVLSQLADAIAALHFFRPSPALRDARAVLFSERLFEATQGGTNEAASVAVAQRLPDLAERKLGIMLLSVCLYTRLILCLSVCLCVPLLRLSVLLLGDVGWYDSWLLYSMF